MLHLLFFLYVSWPQEGLALEPLSVNLERWGGGVLSGDRRLGCGCFAHESADVFLSPGGTTAVHSS